jgi:FkbM family methyltransferase
MVGVDSHQGTGLSIMSAGQDQKIALSVNGEVREFFFRGDSIGDKGVVEQIFQNQDYELSRFPLFQRFSDYVERAEGTGRTGLIIDAGANIGASPIFFHSKYPKAAVVAIEPERNNCRYLERNCAGLNIRIIEGAVGSKPGTLFLKDPGLSDWGFRVSDHGLYEVKVVSVPQILEDFPPGKYSPLILKIDIEGGEKELFSRDVGWLEQIPLLIIELHDWMLPGEANSKNFLKAIASYDFDFVYFRENIFCFNNALLRS